MEVTTQEQQTLGTNQSPQIDAHEKDQKVVQKKTPEQRSKDKIEQAKEKHAHIKEIEELAKEENSKKGKKTIAQQREERKDTLKKMDEKPQVFAKKTLEQKRADREKRNANPQSVKNTIDNEKSIQMKNYKHDDELFTEQKPQNFNPFDFLRKKK